MHHGKGFFRQAPHAPLDRSQTSVIFQTREVAVLPRGIRKMDFTRIFKAGLLASTSALALAGGAGDASAQPFGSSILGLYGGVGFGWETNGSKPKVFDESDGDYTKAHNSLSSNGVFANLFGGYRVPIMGPWVLGGEAKLNFSSASGSFCGGGTDQFSSDCGGERLNAHSRWGLALSVTGGYLMPNGMLPWVKLGYIGKSVKLVGSVSSVGTSINSSKWLSGVEFGAGIDIPIGIIGGSLNMPGFIRGDMSYSVYSSRKWCAVGDG